MLDTAKQLSIPKGLIVADSISFQRKIAEFAALGAAGVHVIFDFDRTLTVRRPGAQDEVTTWHILREHLPEAGQAEYQRLFEKYRALELNGDMTQQDAVQWWSSILNLFVAHSIDLTAVEETFLARASIRPGTVELFKLFADHNIPVIILSAGIHDVIDIWCRQYNIHPSIIISTRLKIDSNNIISGWQEDTLVHVLNKSEATHPEVSTMRRNRTKLFVVGDSLDDASIAADGHHVVKIRILDFRGDEATTVHEEHKTLQKFDAFVKTGSLDPLRQLIELIL